MRYLILFAWILVPLGVWLWLTLFGSPHILGTFRFYDNGDRHNPFAERHYIDCTYYGWTGAVTAPAIAARCPWVRFFKAES